MPNDSMYIPVHVGAEGKTDENNKPLNLGYVKDNTGENISIKNPSFCELTGLYWAWKNIHADYIGLAHYRRHFSSGINSGNPFESVIRKKDLNPYLEKIRIFVPKKQKYYIESLYSHYEHTHYAEHLDKTRKIIKKICPEYLSSYDRTVKKTSGYMFNMMIMEQELFSNYCEWLFSILFLLENEIDASELSAFQGRFYGRVSEIIFNVWLDYQLEHGVVSTEEIKELPVIYMEKIDWNRKILSFIKAKFLHEKYEGSF